MPRETRRRIRNRIESHGSTQPPPDTEVELTDKDLAHIDAITSTEDLDEDELKASERAAAILETENEDTPRGSSGLTDGEAAMLDSMTGGSQFVPEVVGAEYDPNASLTDGRNDDREQEQEDSP